MIAEVLDGLAKNGEAGNGEVEAEGQGAGDRALQALPDIHLISHKPIRRVRSCPLDIRGRLVAFLTLNG